MSLACRLFGHKVDRHRVWNDGIDFRTSCTRCGTALVRDQIRWRAFDPERDTGERLPHPREQAKETAEEKG